MFIRPGHRHPGDYSLLAIYVTLLDRTDERIFGLLVVAVKIWVFRVGLAFPFPEYVMIVNRGNMTSNKERLDLRYFKYTRAFSAVDILPPPLIHTFRFPNIFYVPCRHLWWLYFRAGELGSAVSAVHVVF